MINCLIVDDEPVARSIIRNYCSHFPQLQIIGECSNALEAKTILSTQVVDLLFLDIHMPVLSGISFLKTLKNAPQVILTTAFEEYAVKAFEIAVCDYLVKPFSIERFMIAIDRVTERIQGGSKSIPELTPESLTYFFIKADGKIYKVLYQECLYAEAQNNYTKIVTTQATLLPKMSFSALIDLLPIHLFVRVHRSFIINKTKIDHIEGNRVYMNQKEIPIAGTYRDSFLKSLGIS